MRDEFSPKVKDVLAKRVAHTCSNPRCEMVTVGPHTAPEKVTNIGVAAHITAASVGGPRYNATLTEEERACVDNGIWLCQSCAKEIDSDTAKYTKPLLLQWKAEAERKAAERLNKQLGRSNIPLPAEAHFELIPQNGFIEKEFNGQTIRVFLQGNSLHVEHEIPGGGTTYYIFDEKGNAVAPQWPFPLEDYSVEIEPGLILKTTVEPLADGFTKETIEMKWGKRAVLTRNSQKQLADILVTGATLLHTEKKISFIAPDFKNKR